MEFMSPRVTPGSNMEELPDCFPTPFYIPTSRFHGSKLHILYEDTNLGFWIFKEGMSPMLPTWIRSGLHFLLQLINLRKPKGKFSSDLANALRIKTTSPSEIFPTFIFWPKHWFSWYCTYGSFLYLIYYFYLLSLDKDALKPGQPCYSKWNLQGLFFSILLFFWHQGSCENTSPPKPVIIYLFCEPVLVCEMLVISSQ